MYRDNMPEEETQKTSLNMMSGNAGQLRDTSKHERLYQAICEIDRVQNKLDDILSSMRGDPVGKGNVSKTQSAGPPSFMEILNGAPTLIGDRVEALNHTLDELRSMLEI